MCHPPFTPPPLASPPLDLPPFLFSIFSSLSLSLYSFSPLAPPLPVSLFLLCIYFLPIFSFLASSFFSPQCVISLFRIPYFPSFSYSSPGPFFFLLNISLTAHLSLLFSLFNVLLFLPSLCSPLPYSFFSSFLTLRLSPSLPCFFLPFSPSLILPLITSLLSPPKYFPSLYSFFPTLTPPSLSLLSSPVFLLYFCSSLTLLPSLPFSLLSFLHFS